MPETFDSDLEDDDLLDDEYDQDDPPIASGRGRKRVHEVPDDPIENAGDLPLLTHAGTGKKNTVTYLKITRLDGPRGVRGVKGKMDPSSTFEDVARRYGNGTYKIEGCNYRHQALAREDGVEIAIPGFDDEPERGAAPAPQQGVSGSFGLHGMQMITKMSDRHTEAVTAQANAQSEQVREMAGRTMELLTSFTAAQRESERATHEASTTNQQQFYATMMAMQTQAHAQQMEMLRAMHERQSGSQVDPMQMVQMFMDGLKAGGELGGGEGDEPWVKALHEGTGMLGHLASLANAPGVAGKLAGAPPALPGQPRALAQHNPQGEQPPPKRKKRLPFKTDEIRNLASIKAKLRERGIPFDAFLSQTLEHVSTASDEDFFSDDEPGQSEDNAATPPSSGDKTSE
jgi:hypothetical protein